MSYDDDELYSIQDKEGVVPIEFAKRFMDTDTSFDKTFLEKDIDIQSICEALENDLHTVDGEKASFIISINRCSFYASTVFRAIAFKAISTVVSSERDVQKFDLKKDVVKYPDLFFLSEDWKSDLFAMSTAAYIRLGDLMESGDGGHSFVLVNDPKFIFQSYNKMVCGVRWINAKRYRDECLYRDLLEELNNTNSVKECTIVKYNDSRISVPSSRPYKVVSVIYLKK
jgi:hypothetical protein